MLKLYLDDLREIVRSKPDDAIPSNMTAAVCLIAAVAFFESFFRDQFASIVNLFPTLLANLRNRGHDVAVEATDVLELGSFAISKIGFLLSAKYDFGTPRSVNGIFCDLLQVSPFSKSDKDYFEGVLHDRNILVHHGGIHTMSYSRQRLVRRQITTRVFYDSLVVLSSDFMEVADRMDKIGSKTITACRAALQQQVVEKAVKLTDLQRGGLGFLDTYG